MDAIQQMTDLAFLVRQINNHDKREELTNRLLGKNRDKDRDKLKKEALIILKVEANRKHKNYQDPIPKKYLELV